VYVDDVILVGNSLDDIEKVKQALNKTFKIKDSGELKYFLGLEVAQSKHGIHLYQRKYALDILTDSGMLGCKPCHTPLSKDLKLLFTTNAPLYDVESYRRLVGRLLYLTNTRPDLSFAIHLLSKFVHNATIYHHQATQHVLRYIKSNHSQGVFFPSNSEIHLKGFSDLDWASCPNTRKSTTTWNSKSNLLSHIPLRKSNIGLWLLPLVNCNG